jgi:class 3 adenylate cyclase
LNYWVRLAAVGCVGAVSATTLLIAFGVNSPARAVPDFLRSLVYAYSITALVGGTLPWLWRRLAPRPFIVRVPVAVGFFFVCAATGAFVTGVILMGVGLDPRERFWRELRSSVRTSVLVTFGLGFAMLVYEVLQSRLEETTLKLQETEQEEKRQRERLERLRRFFSAPLADLIVSGRGDDPLKSHRREVTVVFLDLRGFTAFAEMAEPEDVMGVLHEYHAEMGKLVLTWEGTLERFTGDGMMIFFNDPVPVANPAERAVRMAVGMRARVEDLRVRWRQRGYDLDFGIGIAQGYATIGVIGFEGRSDYAAIGTVTNLAARLCAEALGGQILVSQRVLAAVGDEVDAESVGELRLKGFSKPVLAFNVVRLKR